jgi:hypothetical protein
MREKLGRTAAEPVKHKNRRRMSSKGYPFQVATPLLGTRVNAEFALAIPLVAAMLQHGWLRNAGIPLLNEQFPQTHSLCIRGEVTATANWAKGRP